MANTYRQKKQHKINGQKQNQNVKHSGRNVEFRRSKTQNDYNKTLTAAIEKHALPKVPAMEVTSMMLTLKEVEIDPEQLKGLSKNQRKKMIARRSQEQAKANHVEHISNSIGSEAYWVMIH